MADIGLTDLLYYGKNSLEDPNVRRFLPIMNMQQTDYNRIPPTIPNSQVDRSNWPLRQDKTKKGFGWLGTLPMKNGQVASEVTIGVSFDGKDVLIPSLVPTLEPHEVNYILNQEKLSPEMWKTSIGNSIVNKAVEHAKKRMAEGLSPFVDEKWEE